MGKFRYSHGMDTEHEGTIQDLVDGYINESPHIHHDNDMSRVMAEAENANILLGSLLDLLVEKEAISMSDIAYLFGVTIYRD